MTHHPPEPPDDDSPGLPGLASWRGVYWLVLGVFVLWVGLLTLLTKLYT